MNNKLELIRITFSSKMEDICSQQTSQSSKYMSSEKHYEIIEKLEKIRNFPEKPKSQETYRLMKRYEIDSIIIDDVALFAGSAFHICKYSSGNRRSLAVFPVALIHLFIQSLTFRPHSV